MELALFNEVFVIKGPPETALAIDLIWRAVGSAFGSTSPVFARCLLLVPRGFGVMMSEFRVFQNDAGQGGLLSWALAFALPPAFCEPQISIGTCGGVAPPFAALKGRARLRDFFGAFGLAERAAPIFTGSELGAVRVPARRTNHIISRRGTSAGPHCFSA